MLVWWCKYCFFDTELQILLLSIVYTAQILLKLYTNTTRIQVSYLPIWIIKYVHVGRKLSQISNLLRNLNSIHCAPVNCIPTFTYLHQINCSDQNFFLGLLYNSISFIAHIAKIFFESEVGKKLGIDLLIFFWSDSTFIHMRYHLPGKHASHSSALKMEYIAITK